MRLLDSNLRNRFFCKYIDAVYNSFNDSTVIMIAHRLSTIRNFDNILVLDNGRIVESGTHDELMKKHGMYHTMFVNQAKRYEDDDISAGNKIDKQKFQ